MRPELELIEKIEQYLSGEMTIAEKAIFENQIANDPALQEEVRLQEEVMKGIDHAVLRQKIQAAGKKFRWQIKARKWGFGGLSVAIILTTVFVYYKNKMDHHYTYNGKSLPEYNEQGNKNWADADKNITAQTFLLDASKDTVIETKGGIVMAVPAHTFLDENGNPVEGNMELAVKEALDPATMIKAGLSTKSGDQLLESGGMFFTDARKDGKILKIGAAHSIYAEIPNDNIKTGMQLFNGKRMPDGKIDWTDPKPLQHDLIPVDIQTLNFYPPHYLDSLQQWGYDIKNKQFTDSLYYSFARLFLQQPKADSISEIQTNIGYESQKQSDTTNKAVFQDSRTLFTSKCASCHNVFRDMTGPKLGGILDNDYYKGDIKKMAKWIYNVNSMIYSDPYYIKQKNEFGSVMTQFDESSLSEKDIVSIFDYINKKYATGIDDDYYSPPVTCGINPAKIKAIWNDKFQNTILATREFEERLRWIHESENPAILDLYINNLDKSLSFIDSLAALIYKSDTTNIFSSFAARHDGKVKNDSRQFEMLKDYYQKKTIAFTEAITKTQNEFWQKQADLDDSASNRNAEQQLVSEKRIAQNFQEEFMLNLKEAYRQLDKPWVSNNVYRVKVTTTGWCNVDRYVYESTVTRTSLNYTEPGTGKKAVINYLPVSFGINQWKEYDRLYVYLLPDKLSSFMRLDGSEGKFSEKLDELMKYDLVCIAYKDEQAYYYSLQAIQSKDYSNITMTQIGKEELDQKLNSAGKANQPSDLLRENDFILFDIKDQKRQKHNLVLQELSEKVKQLIFHCMYYVEPESKPVTDTVVAKK